MRVINLIKRAWLFDGFLSACHSALGYVHTCVSGPVGDQSGGECVCPPLSDAALSHWPSLPD